MLGRLSCRQVARYSVLVVLLLAPLSHGFGFGPQLNRRVHIASASSKAPASHPLVPGPFPSVCQRAYARAPDPRCSEGNLPAPLKLYPERWLQLAFLSVLALLSDWVCFSVAAAPETWVNTYGRSPAQLIDIFLFTNVAFCFLEPGIVRRFGLRGVVVGAGILMSVGCALRSGIPFTGTVPEYAEVVAGTILVGAAQPFFQCTPPLLSATWFGADERAQATAIAINFNQVGIATAFLVGGTMATSTEGLANYFDLITAVSIAVTAGAFFLFKERPLTPPSGSAAARLEAGDEEDINFIDVAKSLLDTPGFLPPLVAFVCSIGISNVVSAFVDETLVSAGVQSQTAIDLTGAGFQAAIVLGGIVLGGYVDRTKQYKQVTLACIGVAFFLLLPLGVKDVPSSVVVLALISLGAMIGPVQPINAELAVEVAYPADENAVEALQQLCGNLFSALLVPLAEMAAESYLDVPGAAPVRGDTVLLGAIAVGSFFFFSTFDSVLKRSAVDCAVEDDNASRCDLVYNEGEVNKRED